MVGSLDRMFHSLTSKMTDTTRICNKHGCLPVSRFYKEDLKRNRHRCKRCVADTVARWRQRHPLQTLWRRFVQRARTKFGADAIASLSWQEDARPLLFRLVEELGSDVDIGAPLLEHYILTWPRDAKRFDPTQLHLARK
jgi:hypothetical protein